MANEINIITETTENSKKSENFIMIVATFSSLQQGLIVKLCVHFCVCVSVCPKV